MVNNHGDRKFPNWDYPPSRGETLKVSSWKFIEISWNLTADSLSSARSLESGWPSLREGFPGNLLAKVELIHCQNPEWLWMVGTLEPIWTNGISMQTKEQSQLLYIGWFFPATVCSWRTSIDLQGSRPEWCAAKALLGFFGVGPAWVSESQDICRSSGWLSYYYCWYPRYPYGIHMVSGIHIWYPHGIHSIYTVSWVSCFCFQCCRFVSMHARCH